VQKPGFRGFRRANTEADLVIVGTGISGLAAALDAGRAGANVTVIDMWSVFGGHAVMSGGLVCLVDTPFQRAQNIADSRTWPFVTFSRTARTRIQIGSVSMRAIPSAKSMTGWLRWRWLVQLFPPCPATASGVTLGEGAWARTHQPIYASVSLDEHSLRLEYQGHVPAHRRWPGKGVRGVGLRDGLTNDFRAASVVLATGGFESNLELVRQHWPAALPGLEGGAKVLLVPASIRSAVVST